jgi:hypothetical protein
LRRSGAASSLRSSARMRARAAGVIPSTLPACARFPGFAAVSFSLSSLERPGRPVKSKPCGIIRGLIPVGSVNIGCLPVHVNRIGRFNFQGFRNLGGQLREFRPYSDEAIQGLIRISQQLISSSALPILVQLQAMTIGLVGGQIAGSEQLPACIQRLRIGSQLRRPRRVRHNPARSLSPSAACPRCLRCRRQPVFGPRREHSIGFGYAPRDVRSSIMTPM